MKTVFYIVIFILLLFGFVFKISHWPYAGTMLIIALVAIVGILLKFTFDLRKSLFVIVPLLYVVSIIGAMFAVQHWPFHGYITGISAVIIKIILPVLFIRRAVMIKNENRKVSNHLMVIGILLVMLAVEDILYFYLYQISKPLETVFIMANLILLAIAIGMFIKTMLIKNLKTEYKSENRILKYLTVMFSITILMVFFPLVANIRTNINEQFITINEELEKSSRAYNFKRPDLYAKLNEINHPDKEKIIAQCHILKQETVALTTHIEALKLEIIMASGGRDENERMKNPGNYNGSEEIMIKQGKGIELQNKINSIREIIFQLISEDDRESFNNSLSLNADDPVNEQPLITWVEKNFEMVPLAAVITILSKIDTDLRNAETQVLTYILERSPNP